MIELFENEPKFKNLNMRKDNFKIMCSHVLDFSKKHGSCQIIETGTAREKDNWSGDGQSTLVWDWLSENFKSSFIKIKSIDISKEKIEVAKNQTTHVEYECSDSVLALNNFDKNVFLKCGLLYLDSFDWDPNFAFASSFHHFAEIASCWRLLPEGCLIVVDDRHSELMGKHVLVEAFLGKYLKKSPLFKNYQIGFIK